MPLSLAFFLLAPHQTIATPYAQAEPLAIRSARFSPKTTQFSVEDITVDLGATYDNPFDSTDFTLDAHVVTPSRRAYVIPGFLYRQYARGQVGGSESLTPAGSPEWHVRLSPQEAGAYTVDLVAHDRSGTRSKTIRFEAEATSDPGFVRPSPRDHRYCEFDNGHAYFPIGANVCWGGDAGTYAYDQWLPEYGKAGVNYGRLWLSPQWTTFALERSGKPEDGKGMGQFDLGNAWRLDRVLEQARANGMYMMLCIDSYNILRNKDSYPEWEKTPHNRDNGGPLGSWTEFWTNERMAHLYKDKLRYLVARYAADTHVLSWEFWNEVDNVRDYDTNAVREWHQRMGAELRTLDPYSHLVTTSFSDSKGDKNVDLLPEIDYVQTHLYSDPDLVWGIAYQQSRKGSWGKPHYVGEVGADFTGPRAADDPDGLQIHDPIWVSLATGSSGSAMPWWWDNLIAPKHLYPLFASAARFVAGIDWPGEGFRQTDVTLAYADSNTPPTRGDLVFANGPVSWDQSAENRPAIIRIKSGHPTGRLPISGIQHGIRNHPDLHNPVEFIIDADRPTRLVVDVGEVSGYGGAKLVIKLDGERVLSRDFSAGENATGGTSITKYAGSYEVPMTRGRHRITVENTGNDWFRVSYRFTGLLSHPAPPIEAWAITGNKTVVAWVRRAGRTWQAIAAEKKRLSPAPPTFIGLAGLAAGTWRVELWDTWKGQVVSARTSIVGNNGKIRVALPALEKDVAVKLVRQ